MIQNLTKDKGDIGVTMVIADLTRKGIKCALPLCEHLPFDVIAISPQGKLSRLSVKYKSMRDGTILVPLRSISTNMQGYKVKTIDFKDIDALAVFCPETVRCYYVHRSKLIHLKNSFSLREGTPNSKEFRIENWAADFLIPDVIFGAT